MARDLEILGALDLSPLTVRQLLKFSATFALPFHSERRTQERLQRLAEAGHVRRFAYATGLGSAPSYYQLTLQGYRLLRGPEAAAPTKRRFLEIGLAHQHHTRSLADFIVHTTIASHAHGIRLRDFCRENSVRLELPGESLYPDCAFQLRTPSDRTFNFLVELDAGTERVRSTKDVESISQKLRFYDRYQDGRERFRVLIVSLRSSERLQRILQTAAMLMRNAKRSLVYGIDLSTYLRTTDAVTAPCFLDHRLGPVSLIPTGALTEPPSPAFLAQAVSVW